MVCSCEIVVCSCVQVIRADVAAGKGVAGAPSQCSLSAG